MKHLADITVFENLNTQTGSSLCVNNGEMGFHTLLPDYKEEEYSYEPKKRRRGPFYFLGKVAGSVGGSFSGLRRHQIKGILKRALSDFNIGRADGFESGYKKTMNRRTVNNALTDKLKRAGRIAALTAALSGLGGTATQAANPAPNTRSTATSLWSDPWIKAHEPRLAMIQRVSPIVRPSMGQLRERSAVSVKQQQLKELQKIQRDTITFRYDNVDRTPFVATVKAGGNPREIRISRDYSRDFMDDVDDAFFDIQTFPKEGEYQYIEITGKYPGPSQVEWLKGEIKKRFPGITIVEDMNE